MCDEYIKKLQSILGSSDQSEDISLFHYTSIDSFYSILKTKTLWLNPQQNHIDNQELKLGKEIILEVLNKDSELIKHLKNIKSLIDRGFFRVTSSFCTENNISDMWNYYADKFNGVVIEFKLNNIKERILKFESDISPKKYVISELVEYDKHESKNVINSLFSEYKNYLKVRGCHCKDKDELLYLAIAYMAAYSTIIKHDYFGYEKEFRICCFSFTDKNSIDEPVPLTFNKKNVDFHGDSLTDYSILFPFEDQDVVGIYLINRDFDQIKNVILNKMHYINGVDYSVRIKPVQIDDSEINKYIPQPVIVK